MVSIAVSLRQEPRFDSQLGSLSVWSLHILPVSAWVSSGYSGFPSHSKDVRVRWIGHAKFLVSGPLARVNDGVMGIGSGWDCGRCRLDGLNSLLLHCRILNLNLNQKLVRHDLPLTKPC